MSRQAGKGVPQIRCAIYTRKSTDEGLDQEFNSLDAQRESAEAYIMSQKAEGWVCLPERYDDGGYTGGNMDRPALRRLMADIEAGRVDCVLVYKVDRLSRSLMDFARMVETFEKHRISFVSVTQQFNTTHSMGRLTLNILLSFAQFEREIISERTRDKIAAARRKGKWSGGMPVLGYDVDPQTRKLVVNAAEAERVRAIYELYVQKQSLIRTAADLNERGWITKHWITRKGRPFGGRRFDKTNLHGLLTNVVYAGRIRYKDEVHKGEHPAIVSEELWQKVNEMLRSNGRTGGMHIRNKYGALLKGLLYCGPCGCAMSHSYTVKKGNVAYRYYICQTAQKRGWHACPSKSIPAQQIEQFVVEQVRRIGQNPALVAATVKQGRAREQECNAALDREMGVLQRELRQIQGDIRRTVAHAAKDACADAHLADLHERARVAEQRLSELSQERAKADRATPGLTDVEAALKGLAVWETLTPREQAAVVRLLVARVTL